MFALLLDFLGLDMLNNNDRTNYDGNQICWGCYYFKYPTYLGNRNTGIGYQYKIDVGVENVYIST